MADPILMHKTETVVPTTKVGGYGENEAISSAVEEAVAQKEKLAQSLEERFSQPNWLAVSSQFAKPQLGGFGASFGSAMGELGKQEEARRAVLPTIAKMRMEVANQNVQFSQNMAAEKLMQKYKKENPDKPYTPEIIQLVEKWTGSDSDQTRAAKGNLDTTGKVIANTKAAVEAENSNPMIDTMRLVYGGKEATPEEIAQRQQKIVSMKPPQIDDAEWSALPIEQKMARQAQYAKDQALMGLDETQKNSIQAKAAFDTLPMLHTIRDLAMGTGIKGGQQEMAKALNYFGGNSPFDAVARAAADGRIINGKLEGFDNYARQTNMSPEVRDNFQKLVKLLADYQVRAVNASANPTDAYSALKQQGSPNIGNSQKSLVTLVDLLGHTEKHSLDRYTQTMNVPALKRIEALKPLEEAYGKEHAQIAIQDPFKISPSWYNPSAPAPVAAPARTPAPTAAKPATTITLDDIKAARAAQAARVGNPPQ